MDLRTVMVLMLLSSPLMSVESGGGSIVIRRKSSSRLGGGGRLSLMNNRFNKRPKKKNLDPDQLMDILGNFYDPAWMSIEEPLAPKPTYIYKEGQHSELIQQMSNLSQELTTQVSDRQVSGLVERWLLKRASCPVRYAWEDIGALFWPRYIRRGECQPGTCSWPPGMHCVPSGTTTIHVLRWQCKVPRRRKNSKELKNVKDWPDQPNHLKCSWIRVPYPITDNCFCTC